MKIAHWTAFVGSGMHRVAESIHLAEKYDLGLDSYLCNIHSKPDDSFDVVLDADVHVSHTHFPDWFKRRLGKRKYKLVWIGHGTPEHVFQYSVEQGLNVGYGAGDSWMLTQYFLQHADERVTFWPRHQAIWQSLCDKHTLVHCIPLGIDKKFWCPGDALKLTGSPSVLSCENCHYIKWPFDLFVAWPWTYPHVKGSPVLHIFQLPLDKHRWFYPLVNRNGAHYATYLTPAAFNSESLREKLRGADYYAGLVIKGDFNRMSLEAAACGVEVISYAGNPYATHWLREGDQRELAAGLVKILNGDAKPRTPEKVPSILTTARELVKIYAR